MYQTYQNKKCSASVDTEATPCLHALALYSCSEWSSQWWQQLNIPSQLAVHGHHQETWSSANRNCQYLRRCLNKDPFMTGWPSKILMKAANLQQKYRKMPPPPSCSGGCAWVSFWCCLGVNTELILTWFFEPQENYPPPSEELFLPSADSEPVYGRVDKTARLGWGGGGIRDRCCARSAD